MTIPPEMPVSARFTVTIDALIQIGNFITQPGEFVVGIVVSFLQRFSIAFLTGCCLLSNLTLGVVIG